MQLLTMIKRRERGIRCAHSLRIAGEVRAKQNQAGTSKASFQMRPPDDFAEREGFAGLIIRVLAHLIINKLHFLILPI